VHPAAPLSAYDPPRSGEPAFEQLIAVLDSKRPFQSAAAALVVIDRMTAEDFQHLLAAPHSFPNLDALRFDLDFREAFLEALVERWLAVDQEGCIAGIQRLEGKLDGRLPARGALAAALTDLRPELLIDALPPGASWEQHEWGAIPSAFTKLAARDVSAARSYLAQIDDPDLRKAAEIAIARGIAESDPVAAVALAHELKSEDVLRSALTSAQRLGAGILRQVLAANAGQLKLSRNLLELILIHPNEDWSGVAGQAAGPGMSVPALHVAKRLTPEQRQAVLESAASLPAGVRDQITELVVYHWATSEPEQAADWSLARANLAMPEAPESVRVGAAFYRWAIADERPALAWWSRLPESPLRTQLGNGMAEGLASRGRVDEAEKLFRPIPGAPTAQALGRIVAARAEQGPSAAAEWLQSMPPEVETAAATKSLLEKWITKDAAAAARWVETQPAGTLRDAAVQAFTAAAALRDPGAASEWVPTISDRNLRSQAAELVFASMKSTDAAAAAAWLRSVPGLDAAWADRIIRLR
jgi:hypothetical protein